MPREQDQLDASSDDRDKGASQVVTFTWNTDTMALSRYRSRFFLIYVNGNHSSEPGKHIHSSLNVVSWHLNRHSRKGPKVASFWLNSNRGNGDLEDPNHALYRLSRADPPLVHPTGRKRKEASADDGVSTIECEEFEVLVQEEGLIRQCYYCLSWEGDGHRYSQIKHDKYWCPKCKKKGRLLSTLTLKGRSGTRDEVNLHPVERESIYA